VFENVLYKFDGVDLIYSLKPAANIYPIRFENLPLIPDNSLDAKLHERFPLYHGKVPSEGGLLESVRGAVEEMLAAQGVKTSIMATPFTDQKLRQVTAISFFITAPPVVVGELHLNAAAVTDPAAQEILVKQSGSPFDREGSPNQIATNLGNYYRDKGYLDVDVQASPQFPATASAEAIHVPFNVSLSTGPLYRLQSVQLAPGVLVTQAEFDKQSHIHPGDVADRIRVLENWEFLARQYHNRGYMKAEVHPTPSLDRAQGTASFTVNVEPGPLYTMGTLKIDNVSDDIRTMMLAAWKMPAGVVFNESAVRGFYAIGDRNPTLNRLFAAVNCRYNLTLNDDTHTVDVVLKLEKRH
jgi:outer membrane protein insertion porin family